MTGLCANCYYMHMSDDILHAGDIGILRNDPSRGCKNRVALAYLFTIKRRQRFYNDFPTVKMPTTIPLLLGTV